MCPGRLLFFLLQPLFILYPRLTLYQTFIPVAGYVDDAAVIAFVAAAIKSDLDNFLEWEAEQDEFEATNTEENEQSGRES